MGGGVVRKIKSMVLLILALVNVDCQSPSNRSGLPLKRPTRQSDRNRTRRTAGWITGQPGYVVFAPCVGIQILPGAIPLVPAAASFFCKINQ